LNRTKRIKSYLLLWYNLYAKSCNKR